MTKIMQKMPYIRLAIVDFPGAQQSALLGLADLFALLPRLADGPVPTLSATIVSPDALPARVFDAILLPPSIQGTFPAPDDPLLAWIRGQHDRGAMACSVCAGAFWLAEAGLLSGRPATTHWALEDRFRATYPDVDLRPDHILINDLDVVTAGGLMAWPDLGLFLTGHWCGPDMVSRLARHLLIDPAGREQRHYATFRPNRTHGDAAVLRSQRRMDRDHAAALPLRDLAETSGLSLRTFQRRFHTATGLAPASYLKALRIEKARGRLERSSENIATVAWSVGYHDSAAFARAFREITGLTPGAYRKRFRMSAPASLPGSQPPSPLPERPAPRI